MSLKTNSWSVDQVKKYSYALSEIKYTEWQQILQHLVSGNNANTLTSLQNIVDQKKAVDKKQVTGKRQSTQFADKIAMFANIEDTHKRRSLTRSHSAYRPMSNAADNSTPLKSIHLILPNDCTIDANGKCVIDETQVRNKFIVNPAALDMIRKIDTPVAVLSIAGRARSGKSYVMGKFVDRQIFSLGHQMDPETMGVWIAEKPHPIQTRINGKMQTMNVICLDTEGIFAAAKNAALDHDLKITQFSILVSSYFIYNHKYDGMAQDIDFLHTVVQFAMRIMQKTTDENNPNAGGDDCKTDRNPECMPDFMWLLRDLELEVPKDNNGRQMTVREYMLNKVLNSGFSMNPLHMKQAAIRKNIVTFFHSFEAEGLPMPHHEKEVMTKLGDESIEHRLKPKFRKLMANLITHLRDNIRPKSSMNGRVFTGRELAVWIENVINALNSGEQPELQSTWAQVTRRVYDDVVEAEFNDYKQSMMTIVSGNNPLEVAKIDSEHNKILDRIMKSFSKKTRSVFEPSINDERLKFLTDQIMDYLKSILAENERKSTVFCESIIVELNKKYLQWMDDPQILKPNTNISTLFQSYQSCEAEYKRRAIGPSATRVWDKFDGETLSKFESLRNTLSQIQGYDKQIQNGVAQFEQEKKRAAELQAQSAAKQRKNEELARQIAMEHTRATTLSNQIADQQKNLANINSQLSAEQSRRSIEVAAEKQRYQAFYNQAMGDKSSYENQMAGLRNQITALANRPPAIQVVHHHHTKRKCFGAFHNTIDIRRMGKWMTVVMNDLMVGDDVLTLDSDKHTYEWTPVYYMRRHGNKECSMVQLYYESMKQSGTMDQLSSFITLTSEHLIYRKNSGGERELVKTDEIKVGDSLFIANGIGYKCTDGDTNAMIECEMALVTDIKHVTDIAINPLTFSGNMVVSGVDASCFSHSEHNHRTLHRCAAPFRKSYQVLPIGINSKLIDMTYVAFKCCRWLSVEYLWDYRCTVYVWISVMIALILFVLYFVLFSPIFGVSRISYS